MTQPLLKLVGLKTEYEKQYRFYLNRVNHYAKSEDSHSIAGLRMSLKEAREARAMLKVIEEAISNLGD